MTFLEFAMAPEAAEAAVSPEAAADDELSKSIGKIE